MMLRRRLCSDERGVAAIETAFALPILIVLIWMFVQFAQIYRAVAGIQMALGEGARYATLCLNPSTTGCTIPTAGQITARVNATVHGIGPGDFVVDTPTLETDAVNGGKYYDLKVTYTQGTDLLLFPGPDISVGRSKRVWVATT
jgi:Flp pilus assembly protein TadG